MILSKDETQVGFIELSKLEGLDKQIEVYLDDKLIEDWISVDTNKETVTTDEGEFSGKVEINIIDNSFPMD